MHPKNIIVILSGGEMKAAIYFPKSPLSALCQNPKWHADGATTDSAGTASTVHLTGIQVPG